MMGSKFRCILIGISLGGPQILHQVLPELAQRTDRPIIVVQEHLPKGMIAGLTKSLDRACQRYGRPVVSPAEGDAVRDQMIYLIADQRKPLLAKRETEPIFRFGNGLDVHEDDNAIDSLFRSTARLFGADAVAVVMTGSGNGGTVGAKILHEAGAHIVAQDRESSLSWGMPGSVVRAGIVDRVVSVKMLPNYIEGLMS